VTTQRIPTLWAAYGAGTELGARLYEVAKKRDWFNEVRGMMKNKPTMDTEQMQLERSVMMVELHARKAEAHARMYEAQRRTAEAQKAIAELRKELKP